MAADKRVVLLHGDEAYLVNEEARTVLEGWRSELVSDFGFEALDAARLNASQLRDSVLQAPFLDPYRVVVARSIQPARAESLAPALDDVPESTRLLLTVNGRLAPGNRLVKKVGGLGFGDVRDFAALKGRRLSDWASERARQLKLPANVAAAVVRSSPNDLGVIDSELKKLANYRDTGAALDQSALRALLAGGREDEIFQLTDRLLPRPRADSWGVVRNLMANGMGATSIAYRLARHLSLVLEVRGRQERGEPLPEVQQALREHPFVVQKAFEVARSTTPERLEQGLRELLQYEWEVKSGQVDADLGLEVVLAKL